MPKSRKENLTKAQCNKKIRTVLLKYNIDLGQLNYSASNRSIYMGGILIKNNGFDLPSHAVIELVQELSAHGHIRSHLDNWYLSLDSISYIGREYCTEASNGNELAA